MTRATVHEQKKRREFEHARTNAIAVADQFQRWLDERYDHTLPLVGVQIVDDRIELSISGILLWDSNEGYNTPDEVNHPPELTLDNVLMAFEAYIDEVSAFKVHLRRYFTRDTPSQTRKNAQPTRSRPAK